MRGIRRRLFVCALALVVCQIAGMAAAPIALCNVSTSDAPHDMTMCTHGPNEICPMHTHHEAAPKPAPASETRFCRGCDNATDTVLTTLIAFAAPLADRYQPVVPFGFSTPVHSHTPAAAGADRLPTAPPPRS